MIPAVFKSSGLLVPHHGSRAPIEQSNRADIGAFGVDATQPHRYLLRHSRYDALAHDINGWAGTAAARGQTLSVLDVGCGWGPLLCHLDNKAHFDNIEISAADISDAAAHYRRERYRDYFIGDLTGGYPQIASDFYDVVVCEQVLEHLDTLDAALATLVRIVRPGGTLVIGVPIFPPPLHLLRKHLVPRLGGLLRRPTTASHRQAFSLASLLRLLRQQSCLTVRRMRGFRIVSGGVIRWLEHYRWWWRLNRHLGEMLPALCIEVQVILTKGTVPAP
jgi:2-polyprenyl-3-methyl-5-hydroxy-6-metoxy-1,4-benzoquinol methylase